MANETTCFDCRMSREKPTRAEILVATLLSSRFRGLGDEVIWAWAHRLREHAPQDAKEAVETVADYSGEPSQALLREAATKARARRLEGEQPKALPAGRPVKRDEEYLRKRKVANRIVFLMSALGQSAPDEMWHAYMGGRLEDAEADLAMVVSTYTEQKGRPPSFGVLEAAEKAAGGKAA